MNRVLSLFTGLLLAQSPCAAEPIKLASKDTLTVVEIDSGTVVEYQLRGGRTVRIELLETDSRVVFTTLAELKKGGSDEQRTIYKMRCRLRIDGQELEMVRYVPVQESFYEPYAVNGLNIWFDGLRSLSEYFNENHGECLPKKEARFAMQDADLSVCPEEIGNWYPIPEKRLDIARSYGGEDTWMGTYFGTDLHGGLDLSTPSNTTLFAPIDLDDQYYVSSVPAGQNNNRWRGVRTWANGDVWQVQSHHLVEPLVPEHAPLRRGTAYAFAGGLYSGYTSHVHFVFKVKQPERDWHVIDPWILFWQIFQHNRDKTGALKAVIAPLSPAQTGARVEFSNKGSRTSHWGEHIEYSWDFGDGNISTEANPSHVFVEPGIYPVTLTVTDRAETCSYIQHLTVNGPSRTGSAMRLASDDLYRFKKSPNWKTHAHGESVSSHNVVLFHQHQKQWTEIPPKQIEVNLGPELLKAPRAVGVKVAYVHGKDWLKWSTKETPDGLILVLHPQFRTPQPQLKNLSVQHGFYEASILLSHERASNAPLEVKVRLEYGLARPKPDVVVKNSDVDSTKSDFFWLAPKFHSPWTRGYSDEILLNAGNAAGEFVRFRPSLEEGTYRVELYGPPYAQKILMDQPGGFNVRVKHGEVIDTVWMEPARSTVVGAFQFAHGRENYVEVVSDGSRGLIVVDSIRFQKVQ